MLDPLEFDKIHLKHVDIRHEVLSDKPTGTLAPAVVRAVVRDGGHKAGLPVSENPSGYR